MEIIKSVESIDGTKKFLVELDDSELIESVLIPSKNDKVTFCVSTQVGCAMGCSFCATGTIDLKRNLTSEEIVNQVLLIEKETGVRPYSIVYMGMGEPMNNLDNVIDSIKKLNNPKIYNFSMRKITVSTCGIIKGLDRLKSETNAALAISFHATDDVSRENFMPINKKYKLAELIKAIHNFPRNKRERVMVEYMLIEGVNDSKQDLEKLKTSFKNDKVMFNLLEYNPVSNSNFKPSKSEVILKFREELLKAGFKVFVRMSRGSEVGAACGQLCVNL